MSRKVVQVPVILDSKGIAQLSPEDLAAILRAADELIMSGGRTLLSKILKGSHDKKIIELKLDACPAFGRFHHLDRVEILARIDWAILNGYLTLEYSWRLPLLSFTPKGWEIEKDTYSTELLKVLKDLAIGKCTPEDCSFLKGKNRSLITILLDKIAYSKDTAYIHVLEQWEKVDYKKVRERIQKVIQILNETTPSE